MAVERSDADKGLMDQHALPWVEANEDDAHAAADRLRPFGSTFANDRADAAKAVERLVSSGQGEANKALAEHWEGLAAQFSQVSSAAGTIADGMDGCGDIVSGAKNAVLDLVHNLRSSVSRVSDAMMPTSATALQQAEAAEAEKVRPQFQAEATSATTHGEERLKRVRNDGAVGSLKSIAGLPQGNGGGTGQQGADRMHLASAGGSWWGDLIHDDDEHTHAAKRLGKIADHIRDTTSQPLAQAVLAVTELGASGSVGASLAAGIRPLLDDLVLASLALADHLTGPLTGAIKAAAEEQKRRQDEIRDRFGWWR
ncbi:hypothetical protein ACFY8X_05620 [Streptomyces tanashiensis]|uniref:WXG100-like domain-containing protein n=1 Tax=Streptomyces tanashiensis TaxID=67367 RepID=UPI0036E28C86